MTPVAFPCRFRWTCSYRGFAEYEVLGDGARYTVEVRRSVSEHDRSDFNGDEAEWQRDVIPSIGILHRMYDQRTPIPDAVIAAFNAWRDAEYARTVDDIKRRGGAVPDFQILKPPTPVRGGIYVVGTGWVETGGRDAANPSH